MKRLTLLILFTLTACKREMLAPYTGAPVILISIDTLRADHLPAYGYRGVETPAIDALRRDGILYANAYSHCPMTLPSHVSILTGLLPYQHGVRNNIGYRFDGAKHDSLPAMLRRAGYATGAAVSAYVLRADTGLGRLFDSYDDQMEGAEDAGAGEISRAGAATAGVAERWISEHASRPFFFFFHIFEPHWPYEGSYDAEIGRSDAIVGRVIGRLKNLGIYDRALIVLLSDHGEGLGDHGEGEHGVFLYREAIHVPLMVKLPRSERAGTTVDETAQLIDVAPTIADLVHAQHPTLRGLSLLDLRPVRRRIYSETVLPRIHFGWSDLRSLIDEKYHYIEAPRPELYDLIADPEERSSIVADQRRIYTGFRASMQRHASPLQAPAAIDPEAAAKLAALGYIGQARISADDTLPDPKDVIGDLEALKRGSALERSGKLREAASAYESIVARNPRFADAWLRLADALERLGELDRAVNAYRHAIDAAPALAAGIALRLGSVYLEMDRLKEAQAHAELGMKESPEAGSILLAKVWIAQGRLVEALKMLDQTSPIRDREATRGDILARLDRTAEAEAAFKEEIRRYPHNIDAYAKLAFLYAALGRRADAETILQSMFRVSPTQPAAALAAGVWEAVGDPKAAQRWRVTFARDERRNP